LGYGLPILFAVRFCGRKTPFAIAAVSCVIWSWADFASGHQYFSGLHQAWEISSHSSFFFVVAIAGVAITDREVALTQRMRSLEYAKSLEQQINEITGYEQRRVGRELHDGLCQYLAAVSCATSALKIELERRGASDVAAKAHEIETLLAQAVDQGRDLARSLSPVPDDSAGLAAALQELAVTTARRFGIDCSFDSAGESLGTRNGKATQLYRIAQEAIDNAATLGKARSIELRLSANAEAVSLSVTHDGVGMANTHEEVDGVGLNVMRYRASSVGGELQIEDRLKGGTVVSCTIPARI
jgi:signal transduction histidine kinase